MAFDEKGQADTIERKVRSVRARLRLLTERSGFPRRHHFRSEHFRRRHGHRGAQRYSLDFIEATAAIKQRMPAVHVSGGVSNVSFSFRGNDPVREAMHSVFLYHAIRAGSPWASSTPASWPFTRTSPDLRERARM
jgi:5-methyltetrahydrofolate--homocysteine methyltransferase